MNRIRLVPIVGAIVVCLPCILLPVLAAVGLGGAAGLLTTWLGVSVVVPLALFAAGMTLFITHPIRRRTCERQP